ISQDVLDSAATEGASYWTRFFFIALPQRSTAIGAAWLTALAVAMGGRVAERLAFETIVAAGPRTALPHARPGTRKLQRNECIMLDLGAILGGYAGDMTRTVFLDQAPRKAARIYGAVLEAQREAEQAVRVGVPCSAVDKAARRVLERHGYGRYFTHSTGHGVGREIHEQPSLARNQEALLPENAVVTVEPGVYIPGYGGVRIEDVVVVRKRGPEVLTTTPKELTVL
ncbi:MAG: M24 family metallopeptidase, partial [Acidobacteria bacterium]|nr:M24 family metallopeptidase [Acidobacteriota bacterium]